MQGFRLTKKRKKPYAKYEVIIVPESPEILRSHQSPRAGNKGGGKTQTEEEKQEERIKKEAAAKKQRKEFIDRRLEQKEVLEEASSEQRAKIETFQKKAKEKLIERWSEDELKKAAEDMVIVGYELHREGADKGLRDLVREYEYYLVDELYEKLEKTGKGDEALRFYGKLLENVSQKNDPVREAWEEVNRGKALSLEERRTQQMLIERGIYPVAGAAETIPVAGITDPQLSLQTRTANRLLEDVPDGNFQEQQDILEEFRRSVSALTGVDQAQQEQLLERVTDQLVEVRRQIRERVGDIRRRERGEEESEVFLTAEENEGFDAAVAAYADSDPRIRSIADEMQQAFAGARGDTRITNRYLREKLTQLAGILGEPQLPNEVSEQGHRLQRDLWRLKEILSAKIATAAQLGRGGLYAELRMRDEEKIAIVRLASQADPNGDSHQREAWRELEREFSRRFARADVNSSDDWKDALGPGGSIEMDEFISTLANAGENRTRLLGHMLNEGEQDKVRQAVRRLQQEAKLREYLHSITYFVNTNASAEDMIKAAGRFTTEGAQVAFQKRGVAQMLRMYEQAMLEVVAKHGGYLPARAMINNPDGTYGEVESIVLEQAMRAREMGILPRDMEDWEIRRAISLGRGMGIITARFLEIAALHGITKNIPLNSWWANGLVKNIAFFEQMVRFDVGGLQNAILGYKLEGNRGPWSTEELKQFKAMNASEILDILVNDSEDERLGQMKNPFHIGSIFTQTGWRWKGDKVTLASATARLLQYDENNPLIGVGLLIEAKRGALTDNDKNKARQAEQIIRQAISLAAETTPLKLFNNLISLRQEVLKNHYKDHIVDEGGGQIKIKEQLQKDISNLALVQEELLQRRVAAYERYLALMKTYEQRLASREVTERDKPELVMPDNLKFELLGDSEQERRTRELAEHIRFEFTANGDRSYKNKLMSNLKDKGWKVPWVFGADDIPHEAFDYAAITGDTIKRRWDADIGPVVQTAGLYGNFIQNLTEFRSAGDIVKEMKKMHSTLSGHDKDVASDAMRYLAEGVAKFYKKDWTTRLPLGIGKMTGFVGGDASYAQVAFGRGQMAWDELDIQAFLHEVHAAGIVSHDQYEELKKRLGAQWWNLGWAMSRSGFPLLIAAFLYMLINEQLEQLKKAA